MRELRRRGVSVELFDPRLARSYDAVVFDGWSLFKKKDHDLLAEDPLSVAERLKQRGIRIIVDNCDNQFSAVSPTREWDRALERLKSLIALSDRIVVCSHALADEIRANTGAQGPYYLIDDPVEHQIQYPSDNVWRAALSIRRKLSWASYLKLSATIFSERARGRVPLVWYGSHGNFFAEGGMLDLLTVREAVERVAAHFPISLTVISNHPGKYRKHIATWSVPTHYFGWDRLNFLAALRLHRITLIPANLNAFTRCKSSNRLTLSLAHGLAVIADPVPSYEPFADCCLLGHWEESLRTYLESDEPRVSHVSAGSLRVWRDNAVSVIADQWHDVMLGADGTPPFAEAAPARESATRARL